RGQAGHLEDDHPRVRRGEADLVRTRLQRARRQVPGDQAGGGRNGQSPAGRLRHAPGLTRYCPPRVAIALMGAQDYFELKDLNSGKPYVSLRPRPGQLWPIEADSARM